ncbi:scavenger receptor cysteine-rich type 1 protein M130-like [Ruditapes philippinarum]|uniref:scavenger receptor cysteine-rich type 1 protein M130-like n=1 Tax=Ruditapes philippinarum TaxID=129788 RepID=UPI00295BE620|nr:scavenger receptor cysteine-rich type 1 protein M130-like [Ruditapes philippinarum]
MMLLLMLAVLSFKTAYSIDCYNCASVKNISDCQQLTTCSSDDYCYTDTSGIGDQTRFTLGCRSKQVCLSATTTASSLSIIGRSLPNNLDCSQCCAVDSCNKYLCTTGTHVVNSTGCEDDPNYNCAQMSSVFSVCTDTHHAILVCRKFCGLCITVFGNWSPWGSWSSCSVTCGVSTTSRSRACDNPAPQYGGLPCAGPSSESRSCDLKACPVHGGWSRWSSWGSCSVTCGIGLERRDRTCSNPYPGPGGEPCYGDARDDRACFVRPCADGVWSSWSTWSVCSASCLGGISKRTRACNNPTPSPFGHDCVGNDEETKACNSFSCPAINGHWTSWTTWGSCSVTCGGGTKKRTRTCTNPAPSGYGRACIGNSEDKDICNRKGCPNWSLWSSWGRCSVYDGIGMKTRTRTCYSGLGCIGSAKDKDLCNTNMNQLTPFGPVRLVDGKTPYEGRLEVFNNGTWGTVCDDSFNTMAAVVVCKMLFFPSTTPTVHSNAYGHGTLPIILDDVHCQGNESSLFSCRHRAWGTSDCSHSEDVGISCLSNGSVRLVDGANPYEGRLEVYYNGTWGTVCDDYFNETSASVVCKMLSFPRATPRVYSSAYFGQGTLPIILDDVSCHGTESTLLSCSHRALGLNNWARSTCIRCISGLLVRLVGGSTSHRGRVEVSVDGSHWGTVCDDSFSTNSAKVVCRMLGYPSSNARADTSVSSGSGHIFLDDVSCSGTETSLTNCRHTVWGTNNCAHSEDVGVICA